MTLYTRIAVLLVSFVSVSVLILTVFFHEIRIEEYRRQRSDSATSLTAAIAKSVFSDTLEGRRLKVRTTLQSIAHGNTEISYILIIGFDGEVFTSTFPDGPPPELITFHAYNNTEAGSSSFILHGTRITDFAFPLVANLDAHIHVGYNNTGFEKSLRNSRTKAFWVTLGVIILALLAAAMAARRISNPLQQLAKAVLQYGQGEPFSTLPDQKAGPEMAVLIDNFSIMAKQRNQAEQELRIAAIAFETQEAIVITDAETNIIRVNKAFTAITGYPPEEVLGKRSSMFKAGRHTPEFYRRMWSCLLRNGYWSGEIWDQRRNGEIFPKWLTIASVKSPDGCTTHYVGNFVDITERKVAEEHIFRIAYQDTLTGLPNRLSLQERMSAVIALARRDRFRIALMLIDLDRFKQVNDTFGHHIGDKLLIQVGDRLSAAVRESDIVARLGGDEFVVVLHAVESDENAEKLAAKLVTVLSEPYLAGGHQLLTGPSIGVCYYPDSGQDLDDLLKHADIAMYQAKAHGQGCYRIFRPEMQIAVTSHTVIEDIAPA